jgi:putative hydrolase of the HAD superfamily
MTGGGDSSGIRLLLWDFGGVICRFDYRIFCDRLAERIRRSPDEIFVAAFGNRLQRDFERGKLSGCDYHRAVMAQLDADVPYEEFCLMYGDIFTEIPDTCDLLRRLRRRYSLYLLSNTNEIHFDYVKKTVPVLSVFDECIVSYKVGVMKPDPRIYEEALRRSGLTAGACLFVDDQMPNVEGAIHVGMRALRFESADMFAAELSHLGVVLP